MSATELKELRKGVKDYIDHADERIVNIVYAMLEADRTAEEQSYKLAPAQEELLDQQIDLYEKGMMEFSTWEDARARISSNLKK